MCWACNTNRQLMRRLIALLSVCVLVLGMFPALLLAAFAQKSRGRGGHRNMTRSARVALNAARYTLCALYRLCGLCALSVCFSVIL